jgi:hypothetical protein
MVYSVVGKRIKLKDDRCNSTCRKAPPADRGLAEVKKRAFLATRLENEEREFTSGLLY